MKQCTRIWNKDREENQWHTQWACENDACVSPRCEAFREDGFATARDARIAAVHDRLSDKVTAAINERELAMRGFAPRSQAPVETLVARRTPAQNRAYITRKLDHLERGDAIVPPLERVSDELDLVIERLIYALPPASRLYPDLYTWIVADAIREHLAAQTAQPDTPAAPDQE